MAKRPSILHPAVQTVVDETLRDWTAINGLPHDDDRRRAMGRYQAIRNKRIWRPLVPMFVALFAFLFTFPAFEGGHFALGVGLLFLTFAACALMIFGFRSMRITMGELAALSPALRLTRVQRAYLDGRLALHELSLPGETKEELSNGLDRLVEEESRLIAMRDGGVGSGSRPDALQAERDRLAARLAAETDPVAQEALAHSLATCERRLEVAQTLSVAGPRIDAQLEMIAQSAEDVRDGLFRLRAAPGEVGMGLGMEGVRQALEHVQSHTAALESAVAEVRALEARG